MEVATNSSTTTRTLEMLEQRLNSTVDMKNEINETLQSFIQAINAVSYGDSIGAAIMLFHTIIRHIQIVTL